VIPVLSAIFLATLAIIVTAYVFVNRRYLAEADVARARLRGVEGLDKAWSLLKDERVSDLDFVNRMLTGRGWVDGLRTQLLHAGTEMKPGAYVLLVVTCGLAGTFLGGRSNDSILALAFTVIGWAGPFIWLKWKQRRRLFAFETQLPDAIDMMVSAMKAGYSFQAATQFIGDEFPAPAGPEFARFYDEQRLGIDVRTALLSLQGRVDSLDLKMFVTAVLIQRETGGNLSEVLSNLADLIRQRIAMKSHIQTLVAEPKLSARFLAVLPVVVFLVLSTVNPHFMEPLTQRGIGRVILGIAGLSIIAGYLVMMKIADVDI
jgi:tight adherence protein B